MEDVYDYLRWRGDLNMLHSPLNEIDAYILAKFGTLNLQDIIPSEGGMTISEAMLKFEKAMEGLPEEDVRGHSSPNNLNVMRILPGTERFRSLVVSDYIKDIRENYGVSSELRVTELSRTIDQIEVVLHPVGSDHVILSQCLK